MSSKYTRNRQRSIKRKPAFAMLPMIIVAVLMMMVFINYGLRINALNYTYESIENALVAALFSGAVYNPGILADTGCIVIMESNKNLSQAQDIIPDTVYENSYRIFKECLKADLGLADDFTMPGGAVSGPVKIEEYRVYNYIIDENGYHVLEVGSSGEGNYAVRHPDNTPVYVQANSGSVEIKETSVYGKISFIMQPAGGSVLGADSPEDRYVLTRLVAARER